MGHLKLKKYMQNSDVEKISHLFLMFNLSFGCLMVNGLSFQNNLGNEGMTHQWCIIFQYIAVKMLSDIKYTTICFRFRQVEPIVRESYLVFYQIIFRIYISSLQVAMYIYSVYFCQ